MDSIVLLDYTRPGEPSKRCREKNKITVPQNIALVIGITKKEVANEAGNTVFPQPSKAPGEEPYDPE